MDAESVLKWQLTWIFMNWLNVLFLNLQTMKHWSMRDFAVHWQKKHRNSLLIHYYSIWGRCSKVTVFIFLRKINMAILTILMNGVLLRFPLRKIFYAISRRKPWVPGFLPSRKVKVLSSGMWMRSYLMTPLYMKHWYRKTLRALLSALFAVTGK